MVVKTTIARNVKLIPNAQAVGYSDVSRAQGRTIAHELLRRASIEESWM